MKTGNRMSYLVDTYALIEWYDKGNRAYDKYFKELKPRDYYITRLTLLEFYYLLYHRKGEETAETYHGYLLSYFKLVELDDSLLKKSAIFKSEQLKKGRKMSYVDSVNYVAAKSMGIKILTGDDDFKGLSNVEFVK